MWLNWIEENALLGLIIGVIIGLISGGLVGGVSLFLGNLFYNKQTKPVLSWSDLNIRVIEANLPMPGGVLGPAFYSSMVAVYNNGKSAAENCSGHLEIHGSREHVSWFLPSSRKVITINRNDFEFLEICGYQMSNQRRIAPTEEGWQPPNLNRNLDRNGNGPINATVVVTSANGHELSHCK